MSPFAAVKSLESKRKSTAPKSNVEALEVRTLLSAVIPVAAPVSTDLAVEMTSDAVAAEQGSEITYGIVVTNNGPAAVTDATVLDDVSSFLNNASWTATLSGGAVGDLAGTGGLNEVVELPAGASIQYVLTGTVKPSQIGTISNSASIDSPSNSDPAPENNFAGDSKLVVLNGTSGTGHFLLDGDRITSPEDQEYVSEVADFNGDGWNDILLLENEYSDDASVEHQLWINNGDGTFTSSALSEIDALVVDFEVGDIDLDGDLDLVMSEESNGTEKIANVYLNDGNGHFTSESQVTFTYRIATFAMADFNGDGYLDLATPDYENESYGTKTWLNDGNGEFNNFLFASNDFYHKEMKPGDFDGDGDMDLLIVGPWGPSEEFPYNTWTAVLFNNGDGAFDDGKTEFLNYNAESAEVGDLDNDGDLDLVITSFVRQDYSYVSPKHNIWLNNGDGTFVENPHLIQSLYAVDHELADIDGDGDLDLIAGGRLRSTYSEEILNNVWLNDGAGEFVASSYQFFNELNGEYYWPVFMSSGDLNNDGALDIVVTKINTGTDIWWNDPVAELPYRQNFSEGTGGLILGSPENTQLISPTGNEALRFDNSGLTGLSTALVSSFVDLPEEFRLSAEVKSVPGPNRWADGFLIFDYQSEIDFKYAGMFTGQNQWVIGHYQGHFGNRLVQVDWDDQGRQIKANQSYLLELLVNESNVELVVDGESILSGQFAATVINGDVGIASYNAVTLFDNVQLQSVEPLSLPHSEQFNHGQNHSLTSVTPNQVSVQNVAGEGLLSLNSTISGGVGIATIATSDPLPASFEVATQITSKYAPGKWYDGFIVFDYLNENDFKYAGMFTGQNQWTVGHYQGNWSDRLLTVDWDDSGRSIDVDTEYAVHLEVDGNVVKLSVDGELIGEATFSSNVNGGLTGVGNFNAKTLYNSFEIGDLIPTGAARNFPYQEDFESGTLGEFVLTPGSSGTIVEGAESKSFQMTGPGRDYESFKAIVPQKYALIDNYDISVEMTFPLEWSYTGGVIVFDYQDDDNFKFAGYGHQEIFTSLGYYQDGVLHSAVELNSFNKNGRFLDNNQSYKFHLSVGSTVAKFSINGEEIARGLFPDGFTGGDVGFGVTEGTTRFDNFKVAPEIENELEFEPDYRNVGYQQFYFVKENLWTGPTLDLAASSEAGVGLALLPTPAQLPEQFQVGSEITLVSGPDRMNNGYLIFDYLNENDFKYAGASADEGRWVIGHYQGNFDNPIESVDADSIGSAIELDQSFELHLDINGSDVELRVDGRLVASASFAASINTGDTGFGGNGAVTEFNNFELNGFIARGNATDLPYRTSFGPTESGDYLQEVHTADVEYELYNRLINATEAEGFGVVLLPLKEAIPSSFQMQIDTYMKFGGGWALDSFLIFDYVNENDFKYAGALAGQNQWIIGHWEGDFGQREVTVDWDDVGREILVNTYYELKINVNGNQVELIVDDESIANATFDAPVNVGEVGYGTWKGWTEYRDFRVAELTPSAAVTDAVFSGMAAEPEFLST
ncbi:FG-GAP-like repeat-containing protein [Polystyrenella longa]|uniref:FG-GAP-like repeat-containing protein n=1 Tax=Polystyrenella longa TaxID=2528007 RepID=UPI0018D24044|nr:FG-GAP-like repeat-containing protein [Polystyrenella longa]